MGVKHWHVLARFTPVGSAVRYDDHGRMLPPTGVGGLCAAHLLKDGRDAAPRYVLGKCHSWCSREFRRHMAERGIDISRGGLFAPRPKCMPIKDRRHQVRVARYLFDHWMNEAAAVHSIVLREPREMTVTPRSCDRET